MTTSLRSPLHAWHKAHGARLIETEGWQVPASYTDVEQDSAAARTRLALADITSFAKLAVRGPGVAAWSRNLASDGAATKLLGVTRLAESRALACRLTDDDLLLLASAPSLTLRAADLMVSCSSLETQVLNGEDVQIFKQTSTFAGFSLVGEHGQDLLRSLTHLDFPPPDTCVQTRLAGVVALLVHCQELIVPSLRVYVSWELGEYVWKRLLEEGRRWNMMPLGLESWRTLLT